jgi:hypothetical protein
MVGQPKAVFSTTLAVLRPTPGKRLQRRSVFRHLAIVLLKQDPAGFDDVFRFAVKQADGLDIRFHAIHPSASIAAGVLATG